MDLGYWHDLPRPLFGGQFDHPRPLLGSGDFISPLLSSLWEQHRGSQTGGPTTAGSTTARSPKVGRFVLLKWHFYSVLVHCSLWNRKFVMIFNKFKKNKKKGRKEKFLPNETPTHKFTRLLPKN